MNRDLLRRTSRLQRLITDEATTWPENERHRMADELRALAASIDPDEPRQGTFGFARLAPPTAGPHG